MSLLFPFRFVLRAISARYRLVFGHFITFDHYPKHIGFGSNFCVSQTESCAVIDSLPIYLLPSLDRLLSLLLLVILTTFDASFPIAVESTIMI